MDISERILMLLIVKQDKPQHFNATQETCQGLNHFF